MSIDAGDVRVYAYEHLYAHGAPPTSREIAGRFGVTPSTALQTLRNLKIGKTILPHPETGEIWMAGPFAATPTQYRVAGREKHWWANCAWDMLGVAALVREPVHIETRCTDCTMPLTMDVDPGADSIDSDAVVHFLLPARKWYDDIGYT